MKKIFFLVVTVSCMFTACAVTSHHDHKSCPHKQKHQRAESPQLSGIPAETTDDATKMQPKAAGFGTDTGGPTQK